jgi:hypothetical protein
LRRDPTWVLSISRDYFPLLAMEIIDRSCRHDYPRATTEDPNLSSEGSRLVLYFSNLLSAQAETIDD